MSNWTNSDGLQVQFGEQASAATGTTDAPLKRYVRKIADATLVPSSPADPEANEAAIPAGSFITNAYLVVDTAFTSGGAATLTIGTQLADGTAVDADGVDAAIALAALAADKAVVCNGAQVRGTVGVGSADVYVSVNYGTAAYTAGAATLVVEYV